MEEAIVNKVALSGLQTIDLETLYTPGERVFYDFTQNLFMGQILREKDFRAFLNENNWEAYKDKHVAIGLSTDAIVPTWAYMLLALKLEGKAQTVIFGTLEQLEEHLFLDKIKKIDFDAYKDARVVVKGCSKIEVPTASYVALTQLLKPIVKSLMFGEPCSTVPLFKRK